jgi:hypothetical protein
MPYKANKGGFWPMKKRIDIRRLATVAIVSAVIIASACGAAYAVNSSRKVDENWTSSESENSITFSINEPDSYYGHVYDGKYVPVSVSLTLFPTEAVMSYPYKYDGEGVPLPGGIYLEMVDGTRVDATISDYANEDGVYNVAAKFEQEIDFLSVRSIHLGTLTTTGEKFLYFELSVSEETEAPEATELPDENWDNYTIIKVDIVPIEKLFD